MMAGLTLVVILLGCMSFTIDRSQPVKVIAPADGAEPREQQGEISVPAQGAVDVYYPVPYLSRPNLSIQNEFGARCELEVQEPDHFRLHNKGLFPHKVTWVAKGVSILVKPAAPPPPAGPPPPAALPAAPVPIGPPADPPVKEDPRAPGRAG
jgi:hypothetical protein